MEMSPRQHHNLSSINGGSTSNVCNNGVFQVQSHYASPPPLLHQSPPPPPKGMNRSESGNPYPTTFVQADTSSFKQVVQMLTGSAETVKQASNNHTSESSSSKAHSYIPPIKSIIPNSKRQQSSFKLYERRNVLNNLHISPLNSVLSSTNSGFSYRNPDILSPSMLDFPSLVLSPVTPLIPDPFGRSMPPNYYGLSKNENGTLDAEAEDKAIREKKFFLHPSPTTTPRESQPQLLALFPTTSPRESG